MTGTEQSARVMAWWLFLGIVAIFNIALWVFMARAVLRMNRAIGRGPRQLGALRVHSWPTKPQLALCALFVLGCAFRSFLPRAEGQRICLYDAWLSNAALGRLVATVAELALVGQFALLMRQVAKATRSRLACAISWTLLPLIALAELFSWYTTLTTNFIGSVVEETLWATTAALMTATLLLTRHLVARAGRAFVNTAIALTTAYVIFMSTVDVPMYLRRWKADQAAHKTYLPIGAGWQDAISRRVVTRRWEDWREEIPWMTLYFSVGVWLSLSLVRSPGLERAARGQRLPRPGQG